MSGHQLRCRVRPTHLSGTYSRPAFPTFPGVHGRHVHCKGQCFVGKQRGNRIKRLVLNGGRIQVNIIHIDLPAGSLGSWLSPPFTHSNGATSKITLGHFRRISRIISVCEKETPLAESNGPAKSERHWPCVLYHAVGARLLSRDQLGMVTHLHGVGRIYKPVKAALSEVANSTLMLVPLRRTRREVEEEFSSWQVDRPNASYMKIFRRNQWPGGGVKSFKFSAFQRMAA